MRIDLGSARVPGLRVRSRSAALAAATAAAVAAVAVLGLRLFEINPDIGVVLAALVLATAFAARWPALTLTAMLGLAAFWGTLTAAFGSTLPTRALVELALSGLACSVVVHYVSGVRGRPRVRVWLPVMLLGAYLAATLFAVALTPSRTIGLESFRRTTLFVLAFFVMAFGQWPAATRRRMVQGLALVLLVAGAYAMLRLATGPSDAEQRLVGRGFNVVNGGLALYGSFSNRQELGGWMAAALPIAVGLVPVMPTRWRLVSVLGAGTAIVAIFACNTRAALLGGATGLVIATMLFLSARAAAHRRALLTGLLTLAFCGGLATYTLTVGGSAENSNRYANLVSPSQDQSIDNHFIKWQAAIEDTLDHPFGNGIGTAGSVSQQYGRFYNIETISIDNSYLALAYQQGFPVLILYVVSLAALFLWLARAALRTPDRLHLGLAVGACGALAAWMVCMTTGVYIERWVSLLVFVVVGLAANPFVTGRDDLRE